MTRIYIDCTNGISGDMVLNALLDLGADPSYVTKELNKIGLSLEQPDEMEKEEHFHRAFREISELITNSDLSRGVKDMSLRIYKTIAKAEAERDVAIKQAETAREANDARVISNLEIAQKNNELAMRKSDLKKIEDTKMAEADAAYDIQKQIQMKQVNTETVNAQIAQAERQADLRERQVAIKERELDANVRKQAEAERYATEQKAEAELAKRQREAEAAQFEQEREADARKAQAEAQKYAIGYYAKEGFEVVSDEFFEDGISHVNMERRMQARG